MNIGVNDFSLGVNFLREKVTGLSFPCVASNLAYDDGETPFTERYVMTKAGDLDIAIVGVMPDEALKTLPPLDPITTIHVIPPRQALFELLPAVRKNADVVILLSQLGSVETQELLAGISGIDIAITAGLDRDTFKKKDTSESEDDEAQCDSAQSSGKGSQDMTAPEFAAGTPLFKMGDRGKHLGYIRMEEVKDGTIIPILAKDIYLSRMVPEDKDILAITGTDMIKMINNERERLLDAQQQEIERLQDMSPEDFIKGVLKEQKEKGAQ